MNHLFFFIFAVFMLCSVHVSATVFEAFNLDIIEQEISQLDENALVVFDIDYTLIVPNDLILAPCGEAYSASFRQDVRDLQEKGRELTSTVLLKSHVSLVDEKILDLLKALKQKKIKTIALSAMPSGSFGIIPNMELWRVNQIGSLGVDLSWSFPLIDSISLKEFDGKKSQPVFKQGVMTSARYPKGDVLIAFLKQIQWTPSKVIFVDDRLEYIDTVETALNKENIPLISFHYTAAIDQSGVLDKKVADLQWNYLMQNEVWISDEEAKEIASSIK
jgi:hypothetical protein